MVPPAFTDDKDRKMKLIVKTLLAAAALVAFAAQAEGPYVGGSIGASRYSDDLGGAFTDRSDTGLKLYGGYAINPNFSVEAGMARLGKVRGAASGSAIASTPWVSSPTPTLIRSV
jgi:OmpA-OmpF porin, OOP family